MSITRTSAGLRDGLFSEWDRLNSGASNPKQAMAVANLAKQIVNSVKIEIEFASHVRGAAPGDRVALTTPIMLGAPEDDDADA